jgi:hypothetical protein
MVRVMASSPKTKHTIATAWEKAAEFAALAEEAASKESRAVYEELRDSWTQVAHNLELVAKAADLRRNNRLDVLLETGTLVASIPPRSSKSRRRS